MPHRILIAGPTASGKSALALYLAGILGADIVNADALQVYSCWSVLSARPCGADLEQAPHHLYGHISATAPYSAGQWLREVIPLLQSPKALILVGGTGLYFSALTEGLAEIPETPEQIRTTANELRQRDGGLSLRQELEHKDPQTAQQIDLRNPMRVQRAWEVLHATGRGLADWHAQTPPPLLPLEATSAVALLPKADWLNPRIAQRFSQMVENGAVEEVKAWQKAGLAEDIPAAKALGRADLNEYLQGRISLQKATERASIATRQYAKRQRTWMRNRLKNWQHLDPASDLQALASQILDAR